jgi:hypothetical protein
MAALRGGHPGITNTIFLDLDAGWPGSGPAMTSVDPCKMELCGCRASFEGNKLLIKVISWKIHHYDFKVSKEKKT